MNDLAEFLLARIAQDEEVARASHGIGDGDCNLRRAWPEGVLVGRARVLAECEAKRRIVELSQGWAVGSQSYHEGVSATISVALRLLALPYADQADYRQEWKP